jgi:CDP-6-deoxy-D-xylo-4-hexulose-3-dehydrase
MALNLPEGSEIITPSFSYAALAEVIYLLKLKPIFVDINESTFLIDENLIEQAITPNTKAIAPIHLFGQVANMEVILETAKRHNLYVIEDNAQAIGAEYCSPSVSGFGGTLGHIGTTSFFPSKNLGCFGDGGAVFTNNEELKTIAESFRDWGRDCYCQGGKDNTCGKRFCQQFGDLPQGYDHKYTYSHLGYNLKITDMQAACGLAQLEMASQFIQARKENFIFLKERLKECSEYLDLPEATEHSDPSWFGFPMTLKKEAPVTRLDLLTYLDQNKIGTRLLFAGNLVRQPSMLGVNYRVSGNLEQTDDVMNNTFWIGVQPSLTRKMLEFTAQKIESYLGVSL